MSVPLVAVELFVDSTQIDLLAIATIASVEACFPLLLLLKQSSCPHLTRHLASEQQQVDGIDKQPCSKT